MMNGERPPQMITAEGQKIGGEDLGRGERKSKAPFLFHLSAKSGIEKGGIVYIFRPCCRTAEGRVHHTTSIPEFCNPTLHFC